MLAGYAHLLAAADRLQWDAEAIELDGDRAVHAALDTGVRARLTALIAGFWVAEHAVADELGPFIVAADGDARACFERQAHDETRHARFFDRAMGEVLGRDPGTARALAPQAIRELFEVRLRLTARALARSAAGGSSDRAAFASAVGLYHLVLEGIAFAVGQDALHALAAEHGLTGIAAGVARVQADERWHIGLGVLQLQQLGADPDPSGELDASARSAAAAWGPQIATLERIDRVLAVHRRRCAIAWTDARAAP